jgi:hypothetical protein
MSFVVALIVFVAWAYGWGYWLYAGRRLTTRDTVALLISVVAALAAYDGTTLAVREYARANHGVVTAGVVIGRLSSTGADGSAKLRARRSRRYSPFDTTDGFAIHDELAHLILLVRPMPGSSTIGTGARGHKAVADATSSRKICGGGCLSARPSMSAVRTMR